MEPPFSEAPPNEKPTSSPIKPTRSPLQQLDHAINELEVAIAALQEEEEQLEAPDVQPHNPSSLDEKSGEKQKALQEVRDKLRDAHEKLASCSTQREKALASAAVPKPAPLQAMPVAEAQVAPEQHRGELFPMKIILIGDGGVGKTSLMQRFVRNTFSLNEPRTEGIDFLRKTVPVGDDVVRVDIWDTAGQEKYRSIVKAFYRNCHGIIFVFDLTAPPSLANLSSQWVESILTSSIAGPFFGPGSHTVPVMLIANKSDLSPRAVSNKDVQQVISDLGQNQCNLVMFQDTSAKTGENVSRAFNNFIGQILDSEYYRTVHPAARNRQQTVPLEKTPNPPPRRCSC